MPSPISEAEFATFGPIDLVVIQATSYCNLDCDYCYLPQRHLHQDFALELIEPLFKQIFVSPFLKDHFTVCWHAGEPLAVSPSFYEAALGQIADLDRHLNPTPYQVRQSIQTNGSLINPTWCELFKQHHINIGVSLDGPDFIHNQHRKTRTGLGTHAGTMQGIRHLQNHQLDFQVITVITQDSLDYPDEMFEFFMDHGIYDVGFNVEEIEGIHQTSSLDRQGIEARYRAFMQRFWDLTAQSAGEFKLREFEHLCHLIYNKQRIAKRGLLIPFVMLNVDWQGNFSTFDPELLAVKTQDYGDFILGNILTDTLESVCQTEKFQQIYADINAGVELCRDSCEYFGVCGGGAASNKYWENGSFRSSATMACRYYEQILTDVALEALENSLGLGPSSR